MILLWVLFELLTGGGAWWCYQNEHPVAMAVLGLMFLVGLLVVFGEGVLDLELGGD